MPRLPSARACRAAIREGWPISIERREMTRSHLTSHTTTSTCATWSRNGSASASIGGTSCAAVAGKRRRSRRAAAATTLLLTLRRRRRRRRARERRRRAQCVLQTRQHVSSAAEARARAGRNGRQHGRAAWINAGEASGAHPPLYGHQRRRGGVASTRWRANRHNGWPALPHLPERVWAAGQQLAGLGHRLLSTKERQPHPQ